MSISTKRFKKVLKSVRLDRKDIDFIVNDFHSEYIHGNLDKLGLILERLYTAINNKDEYLIDLFDVDPFNDEFKYTADALAKLVAYSNCKVSLADNCKNHYIEFVVENI